MTVVTDRSTGRVYEQDPADVEAEALARRILAANPPADSLVRRLAAGLLRRPPLRGRRTSDR